MEFEHGSFEPSADSAESIVGDGLVTQRHYISNRLLLCKRGTLFVQVFMA